MSPKTKSILALSGTLVIGLLIGCLITFAVVRNRIERFKDLRNPKNFKEHLLKAARADAEQESQIEPILDDFGGRMELLHQRHKAEVRNELDDLQDKLDNYLDDRQMRRVKKRLQRMHGRMKMGPFKNGPPPRGPRRPRD